MVRQPLDGLRIAQVEQPEVATGIWWWLRLIHPDPTREGEVAGSDVFDLDSIVVVEPERLIAGLSARTGNVDGAAGPYGLTVMLAHNVPEVAVE